MTVKKRMHRADRKQAIIEAARPLFALYGFNGTSVRAIAKAADVSGGLLYKYFGGKEQLYKEILGYTADLSGILTGKLGDCSLEQTPWSSTPISSSD